MHVKIAQQLVGRTGVRNDDVFTGVGVRCPWVEIDGRRYDNVVDATVELGEKASRVTLNLICACEVVLLDAEDNEIGTRAVSTCGAENHWSNRDPAVCGRPCGHDGDHWDMSAGLAWS